jgi:7,8-dihydro-6-hydroxymethylpterin-pyrophosphokinase
LRFGPRTLDVDILLFQGVESEAAQLTLPHPRLWQRAFVLVPLAELWTLARGMPQVDVARLAAERAEGQAVTLYVAED